MKQSMRKKIQSSMILVIALTLIIAYAITTLVVYRQTIHIMEGEVRQEADYINVAIDTSGESYLKIMDKVHKDTRITLIDSDGNVKYDSKEERDSYLKIMERKGEFLSTMLEDFFQYSKLASNDRKLELCQIELNELLRQLYEDEEAEFVSRNLQLQLQLYEHAVPIMADMELIVRVVNNLLGNAKKYAKTNSIVKLKTGVTQEKMIYMDTSQ